MFKDGLKKKTILITMSKQKPKLLIAASGTGGHLFPALAVAQKLDDYDIQWLGVSDRLETTLVPECYPLLTIDIEGFQSGLSVKTLLIFAKLIKAIATVKSLLEKNKIDVIFTTGGYIAAPTIIAAKLAKIPIILHESNFIPGKVTKLAGNWCDTVAVGFEGTKQYLPKANTQWVSTPVRDQFLTPASLELEIPRNAPLIVVMGGSQGAVAVNQLVRQCAMNWLENGSFMVHLTGENDSDVGKLKHPNYLEMSFYENMAGLLQRATLVISRSGASALTELAITQTPSILIPYPYAAENHQFYNAKVFADAGAAYLYIQDQLTSELLNKTVLNLLDEPKKLQEMSEKAASLATKNSAEKIANLIRTISLS